MTQIGDNIIRLKRQIDAVAKEHGHKAAQIVAVSKQQPEDKIDAALAAGHRMFGENRVQEGQERWSARRTRFPDLKLHLIGPLQTNKAGDAVALFDVIETVDRIKLADALRTEIQKQGRTVRCLIQVNTGNETQKSGVRVDELPALLSHCKNIGLIVDGLMCIPPVDEPSALHFALLKKIAVAENLCAISMGMSGDFEKAVALGATSVRIGTAVFGARN